ncbi:acetyltransferase [Enterobacterales bacterium]|nr:acetyltransferase [Enterobacterales bacterium]
MKVVLLNAATLPVYRSELASLLIKVIGEGALQGFEPSLSFQKAEDFFHDLRPQITQQYVMLWIARDHNGVIGTVQLKMDGKPTDNQPGPGTVSTLLVHPAVRRSGIARKMMHELEEAATWLRCDMLLSDLQSGTGAESFYRAQGYRCCSTSGKHSSSLHYNAHSDAMYYKPL